MQTAFGIEIPMTLEDVCQPQKMALLVYDMQVGIIQQLPNAVEFVQQVKQVIAFEQTVLAHIPPNHPYTIPYNRSCLQY